MSEPFDVVSTEAILDGSATDAYFLRTEEALEHADRDPHVVAEVTADQFPTGAFEVLAGVKDATHLLEGLPVDVDALAPGTAFDGGPVMRIEGPYRSFARYETSLLGFLSHASALATRALEARLAAPASLVLSFGARHLHPSMAAVLERSALLAGLDGFSHVAAGELLGREAGGTMPHALMISFGQGNQEAAWRAFDEAVGPDVARVALVDTYSDEADEAVRAAEAVADLESVRLDTTGSRRGDFRHIAREVRWKLDEAGHEDVGVFASGGMEPATMAELRDDVEGFGVGSHVSNADPVDFALDIVTVDGETAVKRGKLPEKAVYRGEDGEHLVQRASASAPADAEPLLEPLIRDGEVVRSFDLDAASERCLDDAAVVGFREDADWRA
jgi:nicotinate phosphoribosyltransferase